MTDPDASPDAAALSEPGDGDGAPPARGRARILLALCTLFLVGAVAMAVVAANLSGQLHDERDDRHDVERVSSRFAAALFTFDYRRLDDQRDQVFALSTGGFHQQFRTAFTSLKEIISAGQTVSEGSVTDVFVAPITGTSASAVAVVETSTRGRAGRRAPFDSYVQLSLVKAGGRWLVDDVKNLNFTQSGTAPTTTTTAPG